MKVFKKLVIVDAIRWTGQNTREVADFADLRVVVSDRPIYIFTREGRHAVSDYIIATKDDIRADVGDWIIKDEKGNFSTCKPDIFEQTYEVVKEGGKTSDLVEKVTEIIKERAHLMISHYNQLSDDVYNEHCLNMAKAIVSQVVDDLEALNVRAIIDYIQELINAR